MAEIPPVRAESILGPESPASKEQAINAFNSAASRWQVKINRLHSSINPNVEIDDLADTGLLTDEQRTSLAGFRTFEKGVRGLTGSNFVSISRLLFPGGKDTVTTSFRNPQTGETYTREEGLDISGLIKSAREDIENTRAEVEKDRNRKYPLNTGWVEYMQDKLTESESQLRILEENSVPYAELYPNALDESDPIERARIAEEARRIWKYPLTATGSVEGDKQAAITRLRNSRLLKIPEKAEEQPQPHVPTPFTAITPVPTETQPPLPEAPTPSREPLPPIPPEPARLIEPYGWGGRDIEPPAGGEPSETVFDSRVRGLMRSLRESGSVTVSEIVDRLRGLRNKLYEDGVKVDPKTSRKVDTLMEVKTPEVHRRGLLVLVLPVLLLLVADIPRDSVNARVSSGQSSIGAEMSTDIDLTPVPTTPAGAESDKTGIPVWIHPEKNPFYTTRLATTYPGPPQSFRDGEGLLADGKFVEADYTVRDDYHAKMVPDSPLRSPYNVHPSIEGYSLKGMIESDLARVINPQLGKEAAELEAGGKVLPEDSSVLAKTLDLWREKIDGYYGEGTFDRMVRDFTQRMAVAIRIKNVDSNGAHQKEPVIESQYADRITQGKFIKWKIEDKDFDEWFRIETFRWDTSVGRNLSEHLDSNKWHDIRDEVNREITKLEPKQ